MSRQNLSSSSMSSSSSPQFDSGLVQSLGEFPRENKYDSPRPETPGSPPASGARRWEIRYAELKFEKNLGKGAYGEVWSGAYRKSKVAIKVYDFKGDLTPEQQAAVLSEADLMEGLRSEYLIGFRGICFDPRYCLVMEYADGGTLRARLDKSQEPITLLEQMRWAMQISYGLYQLHSVRIVHRDLKAENILLDGRQHAKVADFGLSVVKSSSASQSRKGGSPGAAGTLPWMAPELFENKPNTVETDVYSLGMLLWEIISRKVPFEGRMAAAIVGMALMGRRETLPENCPKVFELIITACWDPDPGKRPKTEIIGDQFEAALKSLEGVPTTLPVEQELKKNPSPEIAVEDKKSAMTLQNELILACEQGNLSAVREAIQKGAKPFGPDATGKHPIGAAVWGMSPEILDYLLSQLKNEKIPTWADIEKHNRKYYQDKVWIISQFSPENFGDWQTLIEQMDKNVFLRDIHLQIYNQHYQKDLDWPAFSEKIRQRSQTIVIPQEVKPFISRLDKHYQDLKSKIKMSIEKVTDVVDDELFAAPKKPLDEKALGQLLRFVAEGEQDKAEELIKKDNNLLLLAGNVTDLSGREFEGIAAFQYALWAMDWHMWTMIKKYLPPEAQSQQFTELESKGTAHGKHFSLQELTDALQVYVDNAEKWNYNQRAENQWCKVVGGAQKKLPAHVVNEYCRGDRPFEPCPQEWESKLSRTKEMDVWDSTQSKTVKGSWFIAPSSKDGLGLNFAFYRCSYGGLGGGSGGAVCQLPRRERGARVGRPQSSPILVENAHAADGVAEVRIIARSELQPRIAVRCILLELGDTAIGAKKTSNSIECKAGDTSVAKL